MLPPDRYYMGCLCVGINSFVGSYFVAAWLSQWYLRTRHPKWFARYNYILAAGAFVSMIFNKRRAIVLRGHRAALDGGTQVMVFMLSFAVEGAAGKSHLFPQWWGANQNGNYDRCAVAS